MSNPKGGSLITDVKVTTVYSNVSQELIVITVDKLRLTLNQYSKHLEDKKSWLTPLGIFLTLVAVLVTTTFKDAFSIKASTWEAVFLLGTLLAFIWLFRTAYKALRSKSIQDFIELLKASNENQTQ